MTGKGRFRNFRPREYIPVQTIAQAGKPCGRDGGAADFNGFPTRFSQPSNMDGYISPALPNVFENPENVRQAIRFSF
ncbi:MAG: hypothetical protein LBE84_04880 [Planctomycetota bacterium]|nr:hypothetical protein [Planctomycetota bacterium]